MGDKKKKAQMFVKLVSAAGTGYFYVKRKPRQFTEKLEFRKYDPRVNRHVLFTEAKMKFVHERLPYKLLKADPVLKGILLNQ